MHSIWNIEIDSQRYREANPDPLLPLQKSEATIKCTTFIASREGEKSGEKPKGKTQ